MSHRQEQDAARARKAAKKAERLEKERHVAFLRACETVVVPREEMLKFLIQESYLPESATKIVATGHTPFGFSVTFTKESL